MAAHELPEANPFVAAIDAEWHASCVAQDARSVGEVSVDVMAALDNGDPLQAFLLIFNAALGGDPS